MLRIIEDGWFLQFFVAADPARRSCRSYPHASCSTLYTTLELIYPNVIEGHTLVSLVSVYQSVEAPLIQVTLKKDLDLPRRRNRIRSFRIRLFELVALQPYACFVSRCIGIYLRNLRT